VKSLKNNKKLIEIIKTFSLTEKVVFVLLATIVVISGFFLLFKINNNFLVSIPEKGGSFSEGLIGTPRFINPVIANSNVDRDLTSLIYSGLVRIDENGDIIPDIAEKYEVSEDGLIYNFYIKEKVKFHDKELVTADDVIFTILKIQDPAIRSPKISDWENITVEKVSDSEIRFILEETDPDFIKKTTIGILPRHLWQEAPTDAFSLNLYNIEPIGSGPYKIDKIKRDNINIPTSYTLESYNKYALGKPLIDKITFKFAKNETELVEMFNQGEIDSISNISPTSIDKITRKESEYNILESDLPRIFGIFINQAESPSLSINSAREALRLATPKNYIVEEFFNGYANIANNPIPNFEDGEEFQQDLQAAEQILIDAGWVKNENGVYTIETNDETFLLSTSISTSDIPELIEIAETIADEWRKIGADVSVKIFSSSDLNQNVIRPRNFETLLFGNVINNYSDLYSFWHSSNRNDPGLNITSYANIETDTILENINQDQSEETLQDFITEIKNDIPAIFIYSPNFTYLLEDRINTTSINNISNSENRFRSIYKWYINTDKVWEIFNN
jgi:peptide/nickel transport system substrate-binding protein